MPEWVIPAESRRFWLRSSDSVGRDVASGPVRAIFSSSRREPEPNDLGPVRGSQLGEDPMKRIDLLPPALALLCALAASACDNPRVQEQTHQAGEAIKAAGKETGEAVTAAGDVAVEKTGDTAQKKIEAAGDTAKKRIEDAAVTASIKAKLIANADVKAVSIDVDT